MKMILCVGCYRSGREISDWGKMSNDERKAVLQKYREREQQAGAHYSSLMLGKLPS